MNELRDRLNNDFEKISELKGVLETFRGFLDETNKFVEQGMKPPAELQRNLEDLQE